MNSDEISHRTVLFGDFGKDISTIIIEAIKRKCGKKYDLNFVLFGHKEKILQSAEKVTVDVFVLILNNISISSPEVGVVERTEEAIDLAARLKSKYKRPVIALCGYHSDSIQEKTLRAGIDFYFQLPCKPEPLLKAMSLD